MLNLMLGTPVGSALMTSTGVAARWAVVCAGREGFQTLIVLAAYGASLVGLRRVVRFNIDAIRWLVLSRSSSLILCVLGERPWLACHS